MREVRCNGDRLVKQHSHLWAEANVNEVVKVRERRLFGGFWYHTSKRDRVDVVFDVQFFVPERLAVQFG